MCATVTKRRKKETDAHITIVPNPHGADAAPTGCRPVRSPDLGRCLTSKHVVKHETLVGCATSPSRDWDRNRNPLR
jgi:hypothetical protein